MPALVEHGPLDDYDDDALLFDYTSPEEAALTDFTYHSPRAP